MGHISLIETGRMQVRLATGPQDVARALALRARVFRAGSLDPEADRDGFDAHWQHMVVENRETGALAATARVKIYDSGAALGQSYSAQYYDMSGLAGFGAPMLELGRFAVAPEAAGPEPLRLAWAGLTRMVDEAGVEMLFGCTSFAGTDPAPYMATFAALGAGCQPPGPWHVGRKAGEIIGFEGLVAGDARAAHDAMPPLLKTYLTMKGWVSDHAVIDRELGTVHVFTGLEVARVPEKRARALRMLAANKRAG